jgi:hypothetical protein
MSSSEESAAAVADDAPVVAKVFLKRTGRFVCIQKPSNLLFCKCSVTNCAKG